MHFYFLHFLFICLHTKKNAFNLHIHIFFKINNFHNNYSFYVWQSANPTSFSSIRTLYILISYDTQMNQKH